MTRVLWASSLFNSLAERNNTLGCESSSVLESDNEMRMIGSCMFVGKQNLSSFSRSNPNRELMRTPIEGQTNRFGFGSRLGLALEDHQRLLPELYLSRVSTQADNKEMLSRRGQKWCSRRMSANGKCCAGFALVKSIVPIGAQAKPGFTLSV